MSATGNPSIRTIPSTPEPAQQRPTPSESRRIELLFAFLVALFCGWALSLPLFPTQDGPMHKYYVHVIASLFSGSHAYDAYVIRHPFPPYAIHYVLLLGLTRFLSIDMAEKIFICLIFISTAYSFRYAAKALGPSGNLLSLLMVPLVLHWSVVMGFLNYSLAVGWFFLAAGLWIRAAAGRTRLWLPFVLVVVLLTLTHPVPLLLLIVFCALDLAIRLFQAGSAQNSANPGSGNRKRVRGELFRMHRWQIFGLAAACLSFLYPLASADRSRSVANLHSTALHPATLVSAVALYGISPFDTRATNPLIDFYRLGLYAILIGCLGLGAAGFVRRWRSRRLGPGDTMLIGAIAVLAAIPILPPEMNGSDFFSQRLMIFPWLGAIAAASSYAAPNRLRRLAPAFALFMAAVTLLPAEIFIRPVARQLAALEAQPLPASARGLAILDPAMLRAVRVHDQLGFNPYIWSGALPFLKRDDVMLNSPWLDLTIMPLKAAPGSRLMVNEMGSPEEGERLINGNVNLLKLTPEQRNPLLASTQFIVFIGTPSDVQQGLAPLAGADQAARYVCSSHGWYLVCSL